MSSQTEIVVIPKSEFDAVKAQVAETNRKFEELLTLLRKHDMLQTETWLSTTDACDLYKISRSTLMAWKKTGQIEYWQMGRKVRWPKSQLDKHFSKQ